VLNGSERYSKPPGVMGRVSGGKGKGRDFHTPRNTFTLGRVKIIYRDKNIIFIYLKKGFFHLKTLCLTYMKAYYTGSECC